MWDFRDQYITLRKGSQNTLYLIVYNFDEDFFRRDVDYQIYIGPTG